MRFSSLLSWLMLAPAVLLAACTSTTSDTVGAPASTWSSGALSLSVPAGWTQVNNEQVQAPAAGTFIMAFRGTEKFGEFENVNIVSDDIATMISSSDYADTNFSLTAAKLASETPLGTQIISFSDGTAGKIRSFEGKYNAATNLKRYVQTARVCGRKAYVITFTLAATTKDLSPYENMLKTFTCAAK